MLFFSIGKKQRPLSRFLFVFILLVKGPPSLIKIGNFSSLRKDTRKRRSKPLYFGLEHEVQFKRHCLGRGSLNSLGTTNLLGLDGLGGALLRADDLRDTGGSDLERGVTVLAHSYRGNQNLPTYGLQLGAVGLHEVSDRGRGGTRALLDREGAKGLGGGGGCVLLLNGNSDAFN